MKYVLKQLIRERVVLAVIVLNAALLFIYGFDSFPDHVQTFVFALDYCCTVFFVFELTTKITLQGWNNFIEKGWNRFDFAVISLSLPMLLSPVLQVEQFASILILRTLRILKSLRLFHFIPNRKQIWRGIKRALRASIGIFFALSVYIFVLTIFSSYIFGKYVPEHFSNPIISSYTMFRIFTVEGWYEIPDLIARQAGWEMGIFARVYFAFSAFTGGIIGLSLTNAIFVDEMVIDNTRPLEKEVATLQSQLEEFTEKSETRNEELQASLTKIQEKIS